jgi:hypothetical protein
MSIHSQLDITPLILKNAPVRLWIEIKDLYSRGIYERERVVSRFDDYDLAPSGMSPGFGHGAA